MAGLREFRKRQQALARFGAFVLDHEDLQPVLDEACQIIAEALGTDLAKVIEIDRTSNTGLVRAGVGWRPGVVGHTRIDMGERSSEAFAIEQAVPVITNDIETEDRFHVPEFLRDHGVVALVNVPIFLPGRRPWGILQVDARHRREFDEEDIEFLQTYAMILGPVVDRLEIAQDVTDRKRAQQRQEMLLAELQHRVRNILAVIGAMVRRTHKDGQTAKEFVRHLDGRLGALARTQVLLTGTVDAGVDLELLIRDELQSQVEPDDEIKVEGPDVTLGPKAAEVLTLAIHELTTNSVKYGALTRPGAKIEILWDLRQHGDIKWLSLRWSETGVSMVQEKPRRQGFGTELITQRVAYELRGTGVLDMRADGILCTLDFPLEDRPSILQTNGDAERLQA